MSPQIAVPPENEPNHGSRILFLALMDKEWPELKESLITEVWPAYRACWREIERYDLPKRSRARVRIKCFPDWRSFEAPKAIWSVSDLRRSRIPACRDLWQALRLWGANSGRGIRDDWPLESALVSLTHYTLACTVPTDPVFEVPENLKQWVGKQHTERFFWRYTNRFHPHEALPVFRPALQWPPWFPEGEVIWHPSEDSSYGPWEDFERAMTNQFARSLTAYHRNVIGHHSSNRESDDNSARWTIARLAGLTWRAIDERYHLTRPPGVSKPSAAGVYSEGITQAKKYVRAFALEIGLTLADSLATKGKFTPINGHK